MHASTEIETNRFHTAFLSHQWKAESPPLKAGQAVDLKMGLLVAGTRSCLYRTRILPQQQQVGGSLPATVAASNEQAQPLNDDL